jgi:hypothetical protein
MIDRFSLKRLSRFLMSISGVVIGQTLVSVVAGFILGNIMLGIIVLLALIPNLDLMTGIVISNAQLVTITCLAILSTTASLSLGGLVFSLLNTWKAPKFVEYLEGPHEPKRYTIENLKTLQKWFKRKIKRMERDNV